MTIPIVKNIINPFNAVQQHPSEKNLFDQLPVELLSKILEFLPKKDLQTCTLLDRRFRDVTIDTANTLAISSTGQVRQFLETLVDKLFKVVPVIDPQNQIESIRSLTSEKELKKIASGKNLIELKINLINLKHQLANILGTLPQSVIDQTMLNLALPDFFEDIKQCANRHRKLLLLVNNPATSSVEFHLIFKEFLTIKDLSACKQIYKNHPEGVYSHIFYDFALALFDPVGHVQTLSFKADYYPQVTLVIECQNSAINVNFSHPRQI